jgi:hypothetical protein
VRLRRPAFLSGIVDKASAAGQKPKLRSPLPGLQGSSTRDQQERSTDPGRIHLRNFRLPRNHFISDCRLLKNVWRSAWILAEQDPNNANCQWDLAISQSRLGVVPQAQGKLETAHEAFGKYPSIGWPLPLDAFCIFLAGFSCRQIRERTLAKVLCNERCCGVGRHGRGKTSQFATDLASY